MVTISSKRNQTKDKMELADQQLTLRLQRPNLNLKSNSSRNAAYGDSKTMTSGQLADIPIHKYEPANTLENDKANDIKQIIDGIYKSVAEMLKDLRKAEDEA